MIWGADVAVLYNDAWANRLGLKNHASVLARSGQEVWKPLWNQVGGAIEQVKADQATSILEEVAYENEHLALALVPIWGDRDRVDGVLVEIREVAEVATGVKDDFLSFLGHELRTPLSSLSMTVQVMQRQAPSSELAIMDRSVRHLVRLVDGLLDFSRLEQTTLELRRGKTETAYVIDLAMERLASLLEERRTTVFVRAARTGLGVECDPERMAQAIANVLLNASQYSVQGSPVVVEAQRIADRIRIEVRDVGIGIHPAQLERVFTQFRETSNRAKAGLGLGLAIARHLVELHGGVIRVESAGVGSGTTVTIELPHEPLLGAEVTSSTGKKSRKRVLLVEDNHDSASALQKALESLGYQVAVAHNGPVALTVARSFQPDVALLDINLPIMDGWELAKRLRELQVPARPLHFVAVTARDQEQDKQRSSEAGFVEHLVKPIDLNKLERLVESLPDPSSSR
ncbi:MAG TPA: hybrid sensor histidine kinase/response regulator [Kofleriaceae bacterium]|nr:hybrid sensor histidine kinase/response regulator [Kofleriaceae bacterium]